ncbi:7-ethoxycoumarin O-deethylase [Glycine soja]|uniref:7-ethoxycoumarin O-deethylase n=1 Tax=Glycine soja TaxID=3848 RepID=A0A445ISD7_GLYSO|nr:7-ethoxycoumarin O-deethylase [Glycine soja]
MNNTALPSCPFHLLGGNSEKYATLNYLPTSLSMQQLVTDIHERGQMGEVVDVGTAAFKTTINLLSNTIFSVDLIHSTVLKMVDPQGIKRWLSKTVKKVIEMFDSLDIFVAETDTTASTLEWAMTELVRNPHVMSKAKQEL